ncbi:MAG: glycosyltransferase family 39 protein [Rivularia sp. (in: cyanobacteria)]
MIYDVRLVFIISMIVYLANGVTIGSGDTVPNSLLAFNFLENHTFHLDAFRDSYLCTEGNCYFFVEGINGHLSSTYPIGSAIVTFPLYLIFYAFLKLPHIYYSIPIDLTSASFEEHRLFYEKLAATISTSSTVAIFYLSTKLKFNHSISLVSTFIFAFATNSWMTGSQGLWQHGISNLALTNIIFCLLKANRTSKKSQQKWLLFAGIACGLLPSIRPTSALYVIAAIIYSIFTYKRKSIYLFTGLISVFPSIIWNLYYFGNLRGGYSQMFPESPYIFTLNHFIIALSGTLFSPSRGLLVFSPVILLSLAGAYLLFKSRYSEDEKLIGCLTIASTILLFSYFFYIVWWAGYSYGPRFMTDIMPVCCYLINYFLAVNFNQIIQFKRKLNIKLIITTLLIIFSTFTQFVGAFGTNPGTMWNALPLDVDKPQFHYRFWSLKDSQIQRHTRALFHRFFQPPINNPTYIQGLGGIIKEITDENNQPLTELVEAEASPQKLLKANLKNIGSSHWYGYEYALEQGEIRLRGNLYNSDNQKISELRLYVSGLTKKDESANAIGLIDLPKESGKYKLVFDFVAEGIAEFPKTNINSSYTLNINVGQVKQSDSKILVSKIFSQEIKILDAIKTLKVDSIEKIPVLVNNTSNFVWSNIGQNPTNFSYRWLDSNGKLVTFDGERTPLPFNLSPGESAAINAIIKTPTQPGKYTLILTMVNEYVAWFNDRQAASPEFNVIIK